MKRISCLQHASPQEVDRFLRSDPRKNDERILAVSAMGSVYGNSFYNLALEIKDPTHGKVNTIDTSLYFQDIFSRLFPLSVVLEMVDAFCKRYFQRDRNGGGGAGKYYIGIDF